MNKPLTLDFAKNNNCYKVLLLAAKKEPKPTHSMKQWVSMKDTAFFTLIVFTTAILTVSSLIRSKE